MRLVKTDFNEVFDDDYVWASLRLSPSLQAADLGLGDWVELYDEDGETCIAAITARSGPIITCKIDWATWRSIVSTIAPVVTWKQQPIETHSTPSSWGAVDSTNQPLNV